MPVSPINNPTYNQQVQHYALLLAEQFPGVLVDKGNEFGGGNFPGQGTGSGGDNFGLGQTQWTLSDAYIGYMKTHPGANPRKVYLTVVRQLKAIGNLGNTIGGAIGKTSTILGKAGTAAGAGVAQASQDIFHGLDLGGLLMRVGEVVLGIVLIGVGLAKITGAANVVSKLVKVPV